MLDSSSICSTFLNKKLFRHLVGLGDPTCPFAIYFVLEVTTGSNYSRLLCFWGFPSSHSFSRIVESSLIFTIEGATNNT